MPTFLKESTLAVLLFHVPTFFRSFQRKKSFRLMLYKSVQGKYSGFLSLVSYKQQISNMFDIFYHSCAANSSAQLRSKKVSAHVVLGNITHTHFLRAKTWDELCAAPGATGAAAPRCLNSAGAARGQQVAFFYQNCTSNVVRFSHELKLKTVFKQFSSYLNMNSSQKRYQSVSTYEKK